MNDTEWKEYLAKKDIAVRTYQILLKVPPYEITREAEGVSVDKDWIRFHLGGRTVVWLSAAEVVGVSEC